MPRAILPPPRGGGARVARFDIIVDYDTSQSKELSIDSSTEDLIASWSFTVKNNSEVAVSYQVQVILPNALPKGVTMQVDGKETVESPSEGDTEFVYVFDGGSLEALEASAAEHTLTFAVDDQELESDVKINGIQIIVDAKQVD